MSTQTVRQVICVIAAGLVGLLIFEGLPIMGLRLMDGHMAMWYLLWFWYPLVFFPVTLVLTAVGQGASVTYKFAILVAILLLVPESMLIAYRESRQYALLWTISDGLIIVGAFAFMACVAGLLAPPVLRAVKKLHHT